MADDGLGDWRFEAIATIAEDIPEAYPGGPSHKAGARLLLTTVTRNAKGELVGFVTPSATALALNIAITAAKKAQEVRPNVPYTSGPSPDGPVLSVPAGSSAALFDYFEHCMVSVTFSFQALESFCNHSINRNLTAPLKVKRRRGEEILSVEEIERKLSTEEKLGKVLPKILGVPTPSGKAVWEKLVQLQKVRDATIHLKGFDQYPMGNMETHSLFFQLLNHDPLEFPDAAIALINYFHEDRAKPRWLSMTLMRWSDEMMRWGQMMRWGR